MIISGSGIMPGGDYDEEVIISGSGKINGNISCREFTISGSGNVDGNLRCLGKAKISGSGAVQGGLISDEISVSGSGSVAGEVKVSRCFVSGKLKAGSITTNELNVSGSVNSNGDISAENAIIQGTINANGLINAEKFDAEFYPESEADAIGGSMISIRRKGVIGILARLFKGGKNGCFNVSGSIEGDVIDIEHTIAMAVIGREVKIGPGCKIGKVSYSERIDISPEAEVGETEKI